MSNDTTAKQISWNENVTSQLAHTLCNSYTPSSQNNSHIPEREIIVGLLTDLYDLLFPGYSGHILPSAPGSYFSTGILLNRIHTGLTEQIRRGFCYACSQGICTDVCASRAENVCMNLFQQLPRLREILLEDARAALDGDPATSSLDEIILAYPGFRCICIHRLAHELYQAKVPLVPRVMSEYAHTITGIDIHPGATIGRHFFIDHGTGVVIGETAIIGDSVKLYQGVTLGALSFPKDGCGKLIKGAKRHPNIEDHVTIYAESTILGDITIGHHSVIGGNTWLTESVPPYSKVTIEPSKLSIVSKQRA